MKIGTPEDELTSTRLWKMLQNIDIEYSGIAVKFVNHVSPILASIKEVFPFYTRHDAHHGFRVLIRMAEIVRPECLDTKDAAAFTKDELLLLICAAYAHDLGMAVFPGEEADLIHRLHLSEVGWKESTLLHQYLRDKHSERGGKYIASKNSEIGLPNNLLFQLHKLMESHNLSINELEAELGARRAAGSLEIDLKQLACILCISDSIEFSETRVVDGVLEVLDQKLKSSEDHELLVSYRHNMQHACIRDGVAVGTDGKLIFSGTFTDPEVMILAHNIIDLIENWVRSYIDIDFKSAQKRLRVRGESVVRDLQMVGYDFERIGIRLKKEHVIDLISSNATWTSDSAIVIRELLQNSVEACRYRKFHSPTYYQPKIEVIIRTVERTIEIKDNGCGMTRTVVLNHFLTVANSRSFDPSYSTNQYASLARFGIGFWSAFTIAEKANVMTAPFEYIASVDTDPCVDGLSFEVSIKEFKDYTIFEPVQTEPGTNIKLLVKPGVNMADMAYKLSYHIACSEIPIVIDYNEQRSEIPRKSGLPSLEQLFGPAIQTVRQMGIQEFIYEDTIEEIDLSVKILYTVNNGQVRFTSPIGGAHYLSHQDRALNIKYRSNAICGFLFNYHPSTPLLDFHRIGLVYSNALTPKGYRFTLNRMGILDSPEYQRYVEIVRDAIHTCYRKLLDSAGSFNAETIGRLNQESRQNGGEYPGGFTGSALEKCLEKDADLIAFKLYRIDSDRTFANCEVQYVFYDDLKKMKCTLWMYYLTNISIDARYKHNLKNQLFELLKAKAEGADTASFLLEPTLVADMIADNSIDDKMYVLASLRVGSLPVTLTIREFDAGSIRPGAAMTKLIAQIRGVWSGAVTEMEIEGSNFALLSQYHFVCRKGSLLAADIKELVAREQTFLLADIIYKLGESFKGNIDPSIQKYLL